MGKTESLMRKKIYSKPFYRNNDNNYINTTKKYNLKTALLQMVIIKKSLKEKYHTNSYR